MREVGMKDVRTLDGVKLEISYDPYDLYDLE